MLPYKSPGSDGFSPVFYQKFLYVVGQLCQNMFCRFKIMVTSIRVLIILI